MIATSNQVLAGGLVALALVCTVVLVAIGKLPPEAASHALTAVVAGGLTYLQPKPPGA